MAKSPFKLKSGNTTPFKQMGSSPLKQDYVKDIYHAKFNPSGTINRPKIIPGDAINKEVTRIGKGGTPKNTQMLREVAKKSGKKLVKKSLLSRIYSGLGGKLFTTASMYLGSMSTAKADQPGESGSSNIGTYNPKTGQYE